VTEPSTLTDEGRAYLDEELDASELEPIEGDEGSESMSVVIRGCGLTFC
jgi:hypothetical protein